MKKNIWSVVISYNPNIKELKKLLAVFPKGKILIVDNSSDHSNIRLLAKNVILNESNYGFSKAVNQGLNYCLKQKADWIVILNQDIKITKKDLNKLFNKLNSSKLGIVGPKVGVLDVNRWTTILNNSEKGFDYITASFIAVHNKIISEIGYFFEPYFMYYEDVDYCMRARNKKIELTQFTLSSYKHDESSSIGKNSFLHNYYLARNHLLFVERLAPWSVKIYEFCRIPKTIIEFAHAGNIGALRGVQDYLLRRFGKLSYN